MTDIDENSCLPAPRRPEREVAIRELRNAGTVVAELAASGAIGRVTSGGRLVGWLVPATDDEQRVEDLIAKGRLRVGRPGGLAGRRPPPRRVELPALGETLDEMRREEDR